MKKMVMAMAAVGLLALSAPVLADSAGKAPAGGMPGVYVSPPRFQIYEAPRPYGGLVMLDTQTGESFQRVIVNSPAGIEIRWIRLDRQKGIREGEAILWD